MCSDTLNLMRRLHSHRMAPEVIKCENVKDEPYNEKVRYCPFLPFYILLGAGMMVQRLFSALAGLLMLAALDPASLTAAS